MSKFNDLQNRLEELRNEASERELNELGERAVDKVRDFLFSHERFFDIRDVQEMSRPGFWRFKLDIPEFDRGEVIKFNLLTLEVEATSVAGEPLGKDTEDLNVFLQVGRGRNIIEENFSDAPSDSQLKNFFQRVFKDRGFKTPFLEK